MTQFKIRGHFWSLVLKIADFTFFCSKFIIVFIMISSLCKGETPLDFEIFPLIILGTVIVNSGLKSSIDFLLPSGISF
jgi:hypothetical protein